MSLNGKVGKAPSPPAPGAKPGPPNQGNYYAGIGPSIKVSDRLQLRPGTPELDLLRGDTVRGWGMPRVQGYFYGGINYRGHGMTLNGWYQASSRIRSAAPAADLRFSPIIKLNLRGYVSLGSLMKHEPWAQKLRLDVDVTNLTGARPRVRDGNGHVPNRLQSDYLEPLGRTVTLTLRKLF